MSIEYLVQTSREMLAKKIVSKEEYLKLENNVNEKLNNVNKNMSMCINAFNDLIKTSGSHIEKNFPNDEIFKKYHQLMIEIIDDVNTKIEPISLFIIYIVSNREYVESIENGDDSFFIKNSHNNVTNGDENKIAAMFQFKSLWGKFGNDTKEFIKKSTQLLLRLAEKYIIEKDTGNKLLVCIKNLINIKEECNFTS